MVHLVALCHCAHWQNALQHLTDKVLAGPVTDDHARQCCLHGLGCSGSLCLYDALLVRS